MDVRTCTTNVVSRFGALSRFNSAFTPKWLNLGYGMQKTDWQFFKTDNKKKWARNNSKRKRKKVKIMKDIPAKGIVFVSEDQCFFSSSAFLYLLESLMSTFIKTQTYTHQLPKREYRTDENKNTHTRMTTAWVFVACWPALRTHTNTCTLSALQKNLNEILNYTKTYTFIYDT